MRRYISIISYSLFMFIVFFSGWFDKPVLNIDKSVYVIAISSIYILYIIISYIINYSYISFSNDGEAFVFKFISLRPFDDKKKSIVLNKSLYKGAKIQSSFFNLKKDLLVFTQAKKGVVSYPPISISALNSKQVEMLKKALQIS